MELRTSFPQDQTEQPNTTQCISKPQTAQHYSLSQFRFLSKLLLAHGRWGYRRISLFICYYFYKNIVVVFAEICFAFFNGFSGQIYWADWFPGFYNTFWTSWPCIITFCYEQDISKQHSFEFPIVYRAGQLNRYFSIGRFWLWVLCAFFHGMVCFWVPMIGLNYMGGADGKATGLFWISTLSFTLIMHTVSYKLLLESEHWTLTTILAIFLSLPFYYMWIILFCLDPIAKTFQANLDMLAFKLLNTPTAWIVILFTPLVALLPDIGWKAWKTIYCTDPITVLRARLKRHQVEERDLLTT